MTRGQIEACALALPTATKITLWGRMDVYKVRGKVFAIADETDGLRFRATEIAYAVLTDGGPGRPAPGFARGRWVAIPLGDVGADEGRDWIATSHALAAAGLTKKARAEIGLP
jgi:predicted DNA-binding protein (MmcQ/YjbR family)